MSQKPYHLKILLFLWALGLINLHLIAVSTKTPLLWGLDSWSYFPIPWVAVFSGLGLILTIPHTARFFYKISGLVIKPFFSLSRQINFHLTAIISAGLFGLLFWWLRCRVYLLGDGYWWIRNLEAGLKFYKNEPLSVYLNWFVQKVIGSFLNLTTLETFQIVSVFSGVVFVYFLFLLARRIGKDFNKGVAVFLGLLTLGSTQLFFGYVETYPPLTPLLILYLLLAVSQLENQSVAFWSGLVFWIGVFLHLSALSLAPSLGYLYFLEWKKHRESGRPAYFAFIIAAPFIITAGLMFLIGLDLKEILRPGDESVLPFFPFITKESPYYNYSFFSLSHLVDFFNLIMLISPFIIPLCFLYIGHGKRISRVHRFLLLASVFPLGALLLFNPELGFARDWDVFAFSLISPTLLGFLLLFESSGENKALLNYAKTVIIGTSLLHTIPWVLIQASEDRSLARYEYLLSTGVMHSKHAVAFGNEEAAIYYRDNDQLDQAIKHYKIAIKANPREPRIYGKLAEMYDNQGLLDEALAVMQEAVQRIPESRQVHGIYGIYLQKKGRVLEALDEYNAAVKIDPNYAYGWFNLGTFLAEIGKPKEAIPLFQKAIKLNPGHSDAYLNLGSCYVNLGSYDKAVECFNKALILDPKNKLASKNLGIVLRLKEGGLP